MTVFSGGEAARENGMGVQGALLPAEGFGGEQPLILPYEALWGSAHSFPE